MIRTLVASPHGLQIGAGGAIVAASDPDAVRKLQGTRSVGPHQIVQALEALDRAQELAERNVNPQLIVANLGRSNASAEIGTVDWRGDP